MGPEQWHIWKIPAALEHFASVYGTMGVFRPSNYTFLYNSTGYIQSCVHLPYLFIVGHFDIDLSAKIVNCTACALYTCLNHTISYHNASIALVKQRSELWLPINLIEPWTDSVFLSVLLKTGLRRSKHIIGWIIAGILSLISIVTVGTLSGMALHNSIQNHDFITAWHKDSHDLWTRQAQIDQQLQTRINELQTVGIHLGDQVQQLAFQTRIRCHWNFTSFCLTNMPYNSTEYPWNKVKEHLQDLTNNSSLDINLLKQQVANFQVRVPRELYSTQFYDTLTKTLSSLDPRTWLSGSNIFIYVLITLLFLSLIMGYRSVYSRLHASHNGVQLAAAMLNLKTKGGYIGKRSAK
ncbi:endogenous retrovirus group K member 24 Env polyprotein-like [Bos javanicus]|uniref:endogenous retrovirus group K member 24 Env polyprotein-like n=1 Tax=Bos javanicus TaxID=9906 RepID=UPI002AA7BC28|nr:endogenous retrovirus group K member 24 Env polyprotein-like [Bos javanicus]